MIVGVTRVAPAPVTPQVAALVLNQPARAGSSRQDGDPRNEIVPLGEVT